MICRVCGKENGDIYRFCTNCGAELVESRCVACGASIRPGAAFCGKCGAKQVKLQEVPPVRPVADADTVMRYAAPAPAPKMKHKSAGKIILIVLLSLIVLAAGAAVAGDYFGIIPLGIWQKVDKERSLNIGELVNADVGDLICFGVYEQDNNKSNGKEAVEWRVLSKTENKMLLISEYALDCQPYNRSCKDITWEKCSLRTWLNNEFYNIAFCADEQAIIETTYVSADENPYRMADTSPGNATRDKVFLLSMADIEKYFYNDESTMCAPTEYAKAQGTYSASNYFTTTGEATCRWWLRSPGYQGQDTAAVVFPAGGVDDFGNLVDREGSKDSNGDGINIYGPAVRPALWINFGT